MSVKSLLNVESCEAAIARNPADGSAHLRLANQWFYLAHYAKAREHYDEAVRLEPGSQRALSGLANFLATCLDGRYRDGTRALKEARRALEIARAAGELETEWKLRHYAGTVAAAHAELGDYAGASAGLREILPSIVTHSGIRQVMRWIARFESQKPLRSEDNEA